MWKSRGLSCATLMSLAPRFSKLSQAHNLLHTVLKIPSCWSMDGSSCWMILKIGSRVLLKGLRHSGKE